MWQGAWFASHPNADNNALVVAMHAMDAYRFLGYPEGELALAQAAVYLATAPKSNSIYTAYHLVRDTIEKTGSLSVPHHIRNAPTRLMKDLGYGDGYNTPTTTKGLMFRRIIFLMILMVGFFINPATGVMKKWWPSV